jgi:methyl-accepting chemotaxis protein
MKLSLKRVFNFNLKLKGKLMTAYILLMFIFSISIFYVSNFQVRKLAEAYQNQQINVASKTGITFLNQSFSGEFSIINGKLYRGETSLEDGSVIVDKISKETGTAAAIFNGDKLASTSIKDKKGKMIAVIKVSEEVKKQVLQSGKEYITEINIGETEYKGIFIPLLDDRGNKIGMWFTGVDQSKTKNAIFKVNIVIAITTIFFMVIGTLFIHIYINKLIKRIRNISNTVKHLGEGNLEAACTVEGNDEIKDIANSVNITISNIKSLLTNITTLTETLSGTSTSISSASQQIGFTSSEISSSMSGISMGAEEQIGHIRNCEKIIDTLVEKIGQMECQTSNTVINTNLMEESNKSGIKSINALRDKFHKNTEHTMLVAEGIDKLFQSSRSIEDITNTIKAIADKTNLLALNASIEAARAGEAGRGFTVVADEVRKLAEQSKFATEGIHKLIQETIKIILATKENMNEAKETVQLANSSMESTELAFREIGRSTETLIEEIFRIKDNLDNVREVEKNVVNSIENIRIITEEASAATQQVNATAEEQSASISEIIGSIQEQNSMMDELQKAMNVFRINIKTKEYNSKRI